jgi:hypothetical protein
VVRVDDLGCWFAEEGLKLKFFGVRGRAKWAASRFSADERWTAAYKLGERS